MLRRTSLGLIALTIALVAGLPPWGSHTASADQFTQQLAVLEAQANALKQQIASVEHQGSTALSQVAATQDALTTTQNRLATAQTDLDAANQRLASTSLDLQTTQSALASDRSKLARLVIGMYELSGSGSVTAALVDSKSFVDAIDTLTSVGQVSDQMNSLVNDVRTRQQQLVNLQATQTQEQQQATALVTSFQTLAAQQNTEQQQYTAQAASLSGQAAALVGQLHALEARIVYVEQEEAAAIAAAGAGAAKVLDGALPPFWFGPLPDHFPWGQCTWYVASLRDVTWNGDAWAWAWAAANAGRPEGMVPRVGSIVVFGPGHGYSGFGHVAYVRSVQGSTTFTIDEANIQGLGVVDQRTIYSLYDVEAFVY